MLLSSLDQRLRRLSGLQLKAGAQHAVLPSCMHLRCHVVFFFFPALPSASAWDAPSLRMQFLSTRSAAPPKALSAAVGLRLREERCTLLCRRKNAPATSLFAGTTVGRSSDKCGVAEAGHWREDRQGRWPPLRHRGTTTQVLNVKRLVGYFLALECFAQRFFMRGRSSSSSRWPSRARAPPWWAALSKPMRAFSSS